MRLELGDVEAAELREGLLARPRAVRARRGGSALGLVPRRFEVGFGTDRSAPELQRGLELGDGIFSGKIDRIDLDPYSARGIVQDYKSGKGAFSARQIDRERRLQMPLYLLVLRDLVGIEPLGGVYRALSGTRGARGMLRADAREDLPASRGRLPRRGRVLGAARDRARARRRRRSASERATCARPEGRRVPVVVRRLADVPGAAGVRSSRHEARLNEEQLAAVEARRDGLRLRRRRHRQDDGARRALRARGLRRGLDVESVLVITYTRKAAGELRGRIRAALLERGRDDLARELDGAWISTIHGFCARLLRAHPFAVGLDPRFRELDETPAPRSSAARRSTARSTRSARAASPSACGCSRRTGATGCGGC